MPPLLYIFDNQFEIEKPHWEHHIISRKYLNIFFVTLFTEFFFVTSTFAKKYVNVNHFNHNQIENTAGYNYFSMKGGHYGFFSSAPARNLQPAIGIVRNNYLRSTFLYALGKAIIVLHNTINNILLTILFNEFTIALVRN